MKRAVWLLLASIWVFSFFACKNDPDDFQSDGGEAYFPLEIGQSRLYEVDSAVYVPNGSQPVVFSKTYVREVIVDTLFDNNGHRLWKVERYERTDTTLPWEIKKVLTQTVENDQGIRTEDNLRFIKMNFPLQKNAVWDGNRHFDATLLVTAGGEMLEMFKDWHYKITSVGEAETIGEFHFDEVLTIHQADSENLIERRLAIEKYARNVGLVYRELWILDTQCIEDCEGQPWEEKAGQGFILKQTLLSFY